MANWGRFILHEHSLARFSVGFTSRQCIEQFSQAGLVLVTLGTLVSSLDPFGMLDPQVVVNLLP
jgi:hypothetical protein